MPSPSDTTKSRHFISADEGQNYPVFDISGEATRIDELKKALNRRREDMTRILGKEFRSALGQSSIRVDIEPWSTDLKPSESELWYEFASKENPGCEPVMAISRRTLFSISEVFFGDNPADMDDKALESREVSGTEMRLLGRLSNTMLGLCGEAADHGGSVWTLSEPEEVPNQEAIWTKVSVSDDNWELEMLVGWPIDLFEMESLTQEPDFSQDDIKDALMTMLIRARARVAEVATNLADIRQLKAGDIIEIQLPEEVRVFANDIPVITGKIFEENDQLGLKINENLGIKA